MNKYLNRVGGQVLYEEIHKSLLPVSDHSSIVIRNNDDGQVDNLLPTCDGEIISSIIDVISNFLSKEKIGNTICITSSVTAIVTNVTILAKMEHSIIKTSMVVGMLGVHIGALAYTLLELYGVRDIAMDVVKHYANEVITNYITPILRKPLAWVERNNIITTVINWLKPILSVLFFVVGFFLPGKYMDEWCKTINTRITASDKISNTVSDLSNKVLEDVCGMDIYGSKLIMDRRRELAEEGVELTKTPTEKFIRDVSLRRKLFNYTQRATECLAEKIPAHSVDKLTKTLSPINSIINNNVKILTDIIKTIEECTQLSTRPPTTGVLLSGLPGVGKSRFAKYAMQRIGFKLGLDPAIYSVSKSGDYFDPYGGEHFGIHDEFLYMRSEDPIISTITKMISGDYYNMEGAAIHNKKQTCEFKMVSFTTNIDDPSNNLIKKINSKAIEALWDRIVRVEVEDPLITTRHDTTGNLHRKEDYTHLRIKMTIATDGVTKPSQYVEVTPEEYIMYFSFRVASSIKTFSDDNDTWDIYDENIITGYLQDHVEEFQILNNKLLKAMDDKQEHPTSSINISRNLTAKQKQKVQRNDARRHFFVVRLEGKGAKGKTSTANNLADKLSKLFDMRKVNVDSKFPHPLATPAIYLVDDILTKSNGDQYLHWINLTDPRSIIILVTNIKYPIYRDWMLRTYIDVTGVSDSSGIARRLGITGRYKHGNDYDYLSDIDATYVKMEDVMLVENKQCDSCALMQIVYQKYIRFVAHTRTITLINDTHNITDPDISISAKNFGTFVAALKNKKTLLAGYINPTKDFSVKLKTMAMVQEFSNLSSPDTFVITTIESINNFKEHMKTMIEKLCIYKPNATVVINIEDPGISMGYANRCMYLKEEAIDLSYIIKHAGDEIYIPKDGHLHVVNIKDIAMLRATATSAGSIVNMTADELDMIMRYINKSKILSNTLAFYTNSYTLKKYEDNALKQFIIKHPKLVSCVSLISGISATIITAYYIYKKFHKEKPVYKNTTDDEDNAAYHRIIDKYQRRFAQGIDHRVIKHDLIQEYGEDSWREAEWIMRNTNITAQELIEAGDWKGLQIYWKKNPNDVPEAISNQITQEMITFQSDNQIETLASLLEINTVLLTNKTTAGKNFGIGIFGPYLLSVAHAVEEDMEACYIINNGTQHAIKCIWLDRSRDLAIFKLVTHTFAFKDIRHHFGTKDLFDKTKEGYFIRSIYKNRTIAACSIRYTAKRTIPLTDGNDYFRPDTGLYTTLFATTDRPIFLKRGDCGLPLVVRTNEGLRVVGIHNAITLSNMAFFTSVSIEDFQRIEQVQSNTAVFHFHKPKQEFTTHEWYYNVMESEKQPAKVPRCGLTVLGYSKEAHLPSFPKDSHRELLDAQTRHDLHEPLPTKPSALKFKPEIMSADKLIKDNKGVPHTLWTQSVKYTYQDPLYRKWDPVIKNITMDLIKQRYRRDYEPAKFMSLSLNINGDGTTNNKPWDMTTSGGPLLKKLYNVHTKEELFVNKANPDTKPYYIFADNEPAKHVRHMYEVYTQSLEEGIPISIWCKDNRKVELLPSNKVHEGKVRLFNEIDFSVNMVLKKYFGHTLSNMLKNHVDGPYKIGMDVYSEATIYYKNMSRIDGDLLSTDISGCDKTMPAEIIEGFCETMCQGYDEKLIKALAQSLTYTVHIMDGVIYLVDKGNESGSYVTTALNCYGMEVITIYPIVEKLIELNIAPTLNNVDEVLSAIYYGDDRSMKVSKHLKMDIKDLVRCGAYFNFKVTPAKVQSQYISFCSREFIPDQDGVVYPKLKQTSVLSCLFWVKKKETKYIQANINVALFEASLHEREFFIRVVNIVNTILAEYPAVAPYIQIYEYEMYRRVFKEFIYNWRDGPVLLKTGETEVSRDIEIVQNFEQLQVTQNNYNKTQEIMDYVSKINNMSQVKGKEPKYEYTCGGPKESPTWTCVASFDGQKTQATAKTKKLAQQEAAKQIVIPNNNTTPPLVLNMQDCDDLYINQLFFKPYTTNAGFATIDDSKLSVNLDPDLSLEEIREHLEDNNFVITKSNEIKTFVNNRLIHRLQILIENMTIKRNNDQPIEPAVMNQAAMGAQRANLPSQTNPQPTAVMPAMTHSGDDIMGAITTALPETLNPVGAPDMLAVGAITFDIKDLIYEQFLDCDTQLVVSDDAVEGSIIAQIPYGLHSNYINSYIKYYARAHERFNGSIQFRFTVIGNPLFSGAIGIAWYPRKITTTTLPISELMKYSYQAEGVTTPWNKIHILHDARREHFYRLVEDEDSDYDKRPHLVIFLMMSLQNPLREGVQTRIRIASKLANSAEPNPFTFSNPDILSVTPSLSVPVPGLTTAQGANVPSVFPHTLNIDSNVFTDGNMAAPQIFDFGIPHRNLILNGPLNGMRIQRSVSDKSPSGSFFQFRTDQLYRFATNTQSVFGVPVLFNIANVPRKQYNEFSNALGNIPTTQCRLTTASEPKEYLGRDPDAFRTTLINVINTLNEKYLTTKFGIVGLYHSSTDAQDEFRFGLFKIVTTHGVIILSIEIIQFDAVINTTAPSYVDKWGVLTYNQIDVPLNINTIASTLPSDYQILRITDQPATAIITNILTNPTATDDPSISMYYKRLSSDIDVTQCYQFEIQDPVSYRTIAVVRYLQEFGIFVVRSMEKYTYFPQRFSTLMLTTPILVNRTNGFPMTDTTNWLPRYSTTYIETKLFIHAAEHPVTVERNSAIAGGMLSGLGAGLSQKSKNKHELAMQGNQLSHEKDMQKSDQDYGLKYQKRSFAGQAGLAGVHYKAQQSLSKQDYKQKQGLAAQQQDYARENYHRDMLMSGARAPVSGSTSAVSHI